MGQRRVKWPEGGASALISHRENDSHEYTIAAKFAFNYGSALQVLSERTSPSSIQVPVSRQGRHRPGMRFVHLPYTHLRALTALSKSHYGGGSWS